MARTVIGANVDPDIKARLIKAAGSNGKTVNEVIKDLVNGYLDENNKLARPTEYVPTEKAEKLEIVSPEDETIELEGDEEFSAEEFLNEMWDAYRDYAKERGYTLVKTDTLKKLLAVLKAKQKAEEWECPKCHYKAEKPFDLCPRCDTELEWEG